MGAVIPGGAVCVPAKVVSPYPDHPFAGDG